MGFCTINKIKVHIYIQVFKVSDPRANLKPQAGKCCALVSSFTEATGNTAFTVTLAYN